MGYEMKGMMTGALMIGMVAMGNVNGSANQPPEGADRSAQVGDIQISYQAYGSGYPLVMIMGYGSTMRLWEPGLLRTLSSRFKVIVFDNRGIGITEAGQRAFTIEQFADDVSGLMAVLGIPRAHVLGWSMGGLIAEELVLRHPGKVNKLVLYASHCSASFSPPSPEVIEKLRDASGTPEEQGRRFISVLFPPEWIRSHGKRIEEVFYRPMGSVPAETLTRQSMAIGAWRGCCDRLGEIKNPTLVISGADDALVPPRNSNYLAGRIPNAQSVMIEKTGHGLMFQRPDEFSKKVIGFLD